jgi:hypothetical protein
MYVYPTHDYIRMEITVLKNISCYFNCGSGENYTIKSTIDAVKYSNTI